MEYFTLRQKYFMNKSRMKILCNFATSSTLTWPINDL
jgi:hypothetical protein